MSIDPEVMRRAVREEIERDRKEQEREARSKAQDDRISELEKRLSAKTPEKKDGDGDHEFEL